MIHHSDGTRTAQRANANVVSREYLSSAETEAQAYAEAVATTAGAIVWLASITTSVDEEGNSIANDFEAQAHKIVWILGDRLAHFGASRYPLSTLIAVVGFVNPNALLEIKATAVVNAEAG